MLMGPKNNNNTSEEEPLNRVIVSGLCALLLLLINEINENEIVLYICHLNYTSRGAGFRPGARFNKWSK